MARVLIVDDDALMPQLLAKILASAQIDVVGIVHDGDEAVGAVQTHFPDVVLMDIRMERMDGIEATRQVLKLPNPPGIIALTSFDTESTVLDAVAAGAAGFLAKDSGPDEIIRAVRQVLAGEGALSPRAARVVLQRVQSSPEEASRREAVRRLAGLSPREREVALAVAQGRTNAEIAASLFLGEATVKTHVNAVLNKTDAERRVLVATLVAQAGWLAQ